MLCKGGVYANRWWCKDGTTTVIYFVLNTLYEGHFEMTRTCHDLSICKSQPIVEQAWAPQSEKVRWSMVMQSHGATWCSWSPFRRNLSENQQELVFDIAESSIFILMP